MKTLCVKPLMNRDRQGGIVMVFNCRMLSVAAFVGVLAVPSWAAPVSSCPAPCTKPPKAALFVAEPSGALDVNCNTAPLTGTIAAGKKKTVLRLDATVSVNNDPSTEGCYVSAYVNGISLNPVINSGSNSMDTALGARCTITGTYWLDMDSAEMASPGMFIGQPLVIEVDAGSESTGGMGDSYTATWSAQVVKAK